MTTPDGFHVMEDDLYGVGNVRMASMQEDRARAACSSELVASGTDHAERARRVAWRESERVLSLQRLMGG